jgi:flagellar biosynthesis anti-sigma factor FlgM
MKIDERMIQYEISKYLPKSEANTAEKINDHRPDHEQRAEEQDGSGQDTIVNLSSASKEAQKIRGIISSEPDIREDKISSLKQKIESGNYTIDHDRVAGKLVDAFLDELL